MTTDERTHHWHEWDLETLLERKRTTGLTTTLVVPARNEAATVGDVVSRVREALVETAALLDEIVVIDSDSTDETHAVATAAGAVVHRSREIRPDLGTHPGKGEAMWKSLFVTRGDLIVFMDADLVDWDTHFVPRSARAAARRRRRRAGQGVLRTAAPRRRGRGRAARAAGSPSSSRGR